MSRRLSGSCLTGADFGARSGAVEEEEAIATDDQLRAILELTPLDALAVQEHTVQTAVVEHPRPTLLAGDDRMPARHGRIVESNVGREAAPDPDPFADERQHRDAPTVAVREEVARLVELFTHRFDPVQIVRVAERRRVTDSVR